jgi:hypothetical protein
MNPLTRVNSAILSQINRAREWWRVVLRHHPELAPALEGVENAFAPWRKLS